MLRHDYDVNAAALYMWLNTFKNTGLLKYYTQQKILEESKYTYSITS